MRRRITALITLMFFVCMVCIPMRVLGYDQDTSFSKSEQAYIDSSPVLNIGFRQSGKPISYLDDDGNVAGIAPACVNLLSKKSGLKFNLILMDNDYDVTGSLASGDLDAVISFTNSGGSFGADTITSPALLSVPMVLVVRRGVQVEEDTALTFVLKSSFETGISYVKGTSPQSKLLLLDTDDLEDCLSTIAKGSADATFMNSYTADYLLQKPQYSELAVVPQISFTQYLCMVMGKNADPALVSIIHKTVSSISVNDTQNIALANSAGLRYEKTAFDSLYEYRLPLVLLLLLVGSLVLMYLQKTSSVRKMRRVNQELERVNRELSSSIINNVPVGVSVHEIKDGEIVSSVANPYTCELLGITLREAEDIGRLGKIMAQHILPEDAEGMSEAQRKVLEMTGPGELIFRYHRDGAEAPLWYHVSARSVRRPDGVIAVYSCLTDITAEKNATELIQKSQQEQTALLTRKYQEQQSYLDSVSGSYLFAARANITRDFIENIRGSDVISEDIDGMRYTDNVAAFCSHLNEENQAIYRRSFGREEILAAFAAGVERVGAEVYYQSDSGGYVWARSTAQIVRQPETGEVIAFLSQVDITNEKIRNIVLENVISREYDYIACIHCMVDKNTFISMNPELEDIEELRAGGSYSDAVRAYAEKHLSGAEADEFCSFMEPQNIWKALEASEVCSASFCMDINGQPLYKKFDFYCLDRSCGLLAHTRTDFTRAYKLEQQHLKELQTALHAAEQASEAKTNFVSRISHDIRTPIGISINMTNFALEDIDDKEKLRADLERIKASNTFLLSLINDVLDISKIDSGVIELRPEPYTYRACIANIQSIIEPMCQQKGLRFRVEREGSDDSTVLIDPVRFNQITLNLLSNAVKYTPPGGEIVYASHSEILPNGVLSCTFEVRDNGIGMGPKFQKLMFEPYTQDTENPERGKLERGTGLGLAIVKHLVDLMGGTISVRSALGKGTTVRCTMALPRVNAVPEAESAAPAELAPAAHLPLTGTVLLVEDNVMNMEIGCRIIESFGMQVVRAENGAEGVQRFEQSAPNTFLAILMDIQMPVMNGYDAAAAIRALSRPDAGRIPILAMTADAFASAIDHAKLAGMDDYITKPIDSDLLYQKLAELANRPAPAEIT